MAANLTDHPPIRAISTRSGNTPKTHGTYSEKATQTYLEGVPVQINTGVIQKWDGATFNLGIAGISRKQGANLASDGAGAPGTFGQIGFPGAAPTWGSVPNQTSAVNISDGVPMVDGRALFEEANADTVFEAMVDNSAFAVAADATLAVGDIGKEFGLAFDTTGHAYIDRAKVTVGTNTCVIVIAPNPVDGFILNARARFVFRAGTPQLAH